MQFVISVRVLSAVQIWITRSLKVATAQMRYVYNDLIYAEDVGVIKLYGRDIFGQMKTQLLNFTKLKSEPKKALKPETLYSLSNLTLIMKWKPLRFSCAKVDDSLFRK